MTRPNRILIHAAEPDPLARQVMETQTDAILETCNTYEGLGEKIDDFRPEIVFSIRFAGSTGFPRDALLGTSGPRWITVGGSGTDHLGTWNPERTVVTNSAGVAADAMAEYVLGTILHFSLDLDGLRHDKANRVWPARQMTPFSGKTILIIGLGHTGKAVAKRAQAFGLSVLGIRSSRRETEHVDEVYQAETLHALLPRSDFVAVCAPLLESTRNMLDAEAFGHMKHGTILVDVSRGGIVNESALMNALKSKKLRGAGLDVFETEPLPPEHGLWDLENVIISPHCSSVFAGWEEASIERFCANLERWNADLPLNNIVDPSRGY